MIRYVQEVTDVSIYDHHDLRDGNGKLRACNRCGGEFWFDYDERFLSSSQHCYKCRAKMLGRYYMNDSRAHERYESETG